MVAVQHVCRMRGGAQSHLMLGADENLYVVKFQNNPQHLRVLANELTGNAAGRGCGSDGSAMRGCRGQRMG